MEKFTSIPKIDSDYEDKNNEGVTTGTLVDVESYQQQQVKSEKGPSVFTGRIRKLATFASLLLLSTKALASPVNIKLASPDAISTTVESLDTTRPKLEKIKAFLDSLPKVRGVYKRVTDTVSNTHFLRVYLKGVDSEQEKIALKTEAESLGLEVTAKPQLYYIDFKTGSKNIPYFEALKRNQLLPAEVVSLFAESTEGQEGTENTSGGDDKFYDGPESHTRKAFGNWMVGLGFSLEMQASVKAGVVMENQNSMGWQVYNLWQYSSHMDEWHDANFWKNLISDRELLKKISDQNAENASEDSPIKTLRKLLSVTHLKKTLHEKYMVPVPEYGGVSYYTHYGGKGKALKLRIEGELKGLSEEAVKLFSQIYSGK